VTSRAGANVLLGVGQMVLWPVHLARPVTGRPGFAATYPSGTARAAIYADAVGRPGARVWQGDAALAVSAAGHYFHANAVTLGQGVWWVRDGRVGASGAWTITSSGGAGSVSGTVATITDVFQQVSNIDLDALPDGTLTLSFVQTVSGVAGPAVTATTPKTQIDCADAAVLATAPPGVRCADGSLYVGSFEGRHLITHARGCGHEPGGDIGSSAAAEFTPNCAGASEELTKYWSSALNFLEAATSTSDGRANSGHLMADAQVANPAAA
jgi:hypothetical protein